MNDFFTLQRDGHIAHLQLNRPERMNTMSPTFFPALRDTVRDLQDDAQTRVLVVSSTGKHFSAGMALDVFAGSPSPAGGPAHDRRDPNGDAQRQAVGALMQMLDTRSARARLSFQEALRRLIDCFSALDEVRFPVICAVQGGCIGGALDLATACDIRLCSADAFFTVQEIHIGMMADLGVLQRLAKIVPQGVARQMAYTGERVEARRALEVGLVNAVLPDAGALLDHAMALAKQIAAKSPLAVAGSKLALNQARDHGTAAALNQMALLQSAIFDTAEMAEAISAWKDKRDGEFAPLTPIARF
ncbi:enoyl-CoA hydratase-related protein [uncultured Piscinibacter sp.]|uniref:enoyl-CoA hydratase-related protein n=1 Tax=uncultured Piscinibacter sp. TaxID=1131835 RepID=UPI0026221E45|nr:enoyl-CoA hydratase-related protein [uncultured Piscinibacter sp.]